MRRTLIFERVRKSPDPLIPADAGIQTLPNHWHLIGQRLGPRVRGDERP
jgi:hypothetical protein